ncbi:MAG: hypothetical protein ACOC5T_03965 [Elusimicrobiota bacterium]
MKLIKIFVPCILILLMIGCAAPSLHIDKPEWPVPGERKATVLKNPVTGETGVWEPVWSEKNGAVYTLELEKRNKKCDNIIDKFNSK